MRVPQVSGTALRTGWGGGGGNTLSGSHYRSGVVGGVEGTFSPSAFFLPIGELEVSERKVVSVASVRQDAGRLGYYF